MADIRVRQTCPSSDDADSKHEESLPLVVAMEDGIGTKRMGQWEEAVDLGIPVCTPQRSGARASCPAFPLHRAKEASTSAGFL